MKLIYAKYPGKCQHCGSKTDRNEEVWWEPGTGVMHQPCKAEWEREGVNWLASHLSTRG